jgi:hypothetical protein
MIEMTVEHPYSLYIVPLNCSNIIKTKTKQVGTIPLKLMCWEWMWCSCSALQQNDREMGFGAATYKDIGKQHITLKDSLWSGSTCEVHLQFTGKETHLECNTQSALSMFTFITKYWCTWNHLARTQTNLWHPLRKFHFSSIPLLVSLSKEVLFFVITLGPSPVLSR